MSSGNLTKIRFPILVFVFFCVAACAIQPAAAIKVEGSRIVLDVVPGTTYTFPMAISIAPTDAAADYAVDVLGFGQSLVGGSYTPLSAAADTSPYSARPFITVPSPVIDLAPGQRTAFNATISVPLNVGEGGRYALIYIHPSMTGSGQASIATAIIVPVALTIQNSKLTETGSITNVSVGTIVAGQPIKVSTTLENTGNYYYRGLVNQVTMTDASGNVVGTAASAPTTQSLIPGNSVRLDAPFSTPLEVGTYTVKSEMLLNSTVLDSNSTSITVNEAYIPPFQTANVTISPNSPATLSVPGGIISISFPQGSVLAATTVTVSPYTGTLPALPAGATAGSTGFSVDGLNGLLANDATITVKYSQADLTAAGNDASKLVLGRYDSNAWTLLPTTVDTNAMTLTASTNRFSTWAVIAAQSSSGAEAAPAGSARSSGTGKSGFMGLGLGLDPLLIIGAIGFVIIATGIKRK